MKRELADKLNKKYPNLLKGPHDNGVYIECGDGWYDLLDDLFLHLERIVEEEKSEESHIVKVKRKSGAIRIYMSSQSDQMTDAIMDAEVLSQKTCEICGKPGKISGSAHKTCRCKEHSNDNTVS